MGDEFEGCDVDKFKTEPDDLEEEELKKDMKALQTTKALSQVPKTMNTSRSNQKQKTPRSITIIYQFTIYSY